MRIAKADLVPPPANLLDDYDILAELEQGNAAFCEQVKIETNISGSGVLDPTVR